MCESCRKLNLRFLSKQTETFLVSVTHLILRFDILQNKFQETNKTKINQINNNHIKFEVSLHFGGSGLLCAAAQQQTGQTICNESIPCSRSTSCLVYMADRGFHFVYVSVLCNCENLLQNGNFIQQSSLLSFQVCFRKMT
jgi:hypothetical protein